MKDFEQLFEENRDFIFRYLLKLTKDGHLAEELTQETFFRAYINFAALRDPSKAPVWLCQIAKHAFFSWYHQQKKMDSTEELENLAAPESLEETAMQKVLSQEAMAYLAQLEEPYKEVFMLCVFGECSLKEISVLFGKSESWARVTFYRAKQKLQEQLR